MIRRSIPSHARATLLLTLFAVIVPGPSAHSQDRAAQDRLDRLERDLTMLQRQVYRGGGPSYGTGAAVDTELRMDRLETQMRELTGRVEDAVNRVEQLRLRLEQINGDIDTRLSQGQGGSARAAPSSSHAAADLADASPTGPVAMRGPAPGGSPSRGTPVPPPRDPPPGMGTLTPPGTPASGSEPAHVASAGSMRALPGSSASEQYNAAFGLLKQADYPAAEEAMKAFIAQHPHDRLAGSAQYWLGETYYARRRYAEAATAFAEGYKRYPKGSKAADDLLKLGMSLARANQKQNACIALAQLDRDFPNPRAAIKERAAAEKKRLGC